MLLEYLFYGEARRAYVLYHNNSIYQGALGMQINALGIRNHYQRGKGTSRGKNFPLIILFFKEKILHTYDEVVKKP